MAVIGVWTKRIRIGRHYPKVRIELYQNHWGEIATYREWEGFGFMRYEAAVKLLGERVTTSVGDVYITFCTNRTNFFRFTGAGKLLIKGVE